jgi:hypothetical protein
MHTIRALNRARAQHSILSTTGRASSRTAAFEDATVLARCNARSNETPTTGMFTLRSDCPGLCHNHCADRTCRGSVVYLHLERTGAPAEQCDRAPAEGSEILLLAAAGRGKGRAAGR